MLPAIDEKQQDRIFKPTFSLEVYQFPPWKLAETTQQRKADRLPTMLAFRGFNSLFNPETAPCGTRPRSKVPRFWDRPTRGFLGDEWSGEVVWETSNKQKYTEWVRFDFFPMRKFNDVNQDSEWNVRVFDRAVKRALMIISDRGSRGKFHCWNCISWFCTQDFGEWWRSTWR